MKYSSPARLLSDAELLDYSKEHLRYEIWMFFTSGIELARIHFSESDALSVFYKNVLVESFANHLRNLLLFIYPYSPGEDDVVSNYYFLDPIVEWKQKRPRETETLRNARARASQEISHLTVFRRDPTDESKKWPVAELMNEIKAILKVFVDNASIAKLDGSVKDLLDSVDRNTSSSTVSTTVTICSSSTPSATNVFQSVSMDFKPTNRP